MTRLPSPFRRLTRHLLRSLLQYAPVRLRDLARRIPFSRLSWLLPRVFWGYEQIIWRGVTIGINPGEVHGFYPYFLGDYANEEIDVLIGLNASARIFADVGANIGLVSLAIAQACPHLRVYAFEPDPVIAARFRSNLLLNPPLVSRIILVEKAVADEEHTLFFHSAAGGRNAGTGHLVAYEAGSIAVEAVRLDTFFSSQGSYPDVVKIDIEGAELRALEGMNGIFKTDAPNYLMVEVHSFYLPSEDRQEFNRRIEELLLEKGYVLSNIDGSSLAPAAEWPSRIHIQAAHNTLS